MALWWYRWSVLFVLSWGVVVFGAVYPWAYWPLLIGCLATGALGLVAGSQPLNRSVALGLIMIAAAVLVQLIPVPRPVLAGVSPATDVFLQQHDIVEIAAALPPVAAALSIDTKNAATRRRVHPFSVDAVATTRGLLFIAGFGVFVLGLARALNGPDIRFLIVGLTILAGVLSLVGMVQRANLDRTIYGVWQPFDRGNPFGPFVNPNHFGGWIVMVLPLGAGYLLARLHGRHSSPPMTMMRERALWLSSPQASQTILMGLLLAVMALALVLTLSRSAIGCLAVVLTFLSWMVVRRDRVRSRRNGTLAYLVFVAFISLSWVGLDRVVTEFIGHDATGSGLGDRQVIWRDTSEIIRDFPLVGSGLNTYKTAMLLYEEPHPGHDFRAVEAHNDYLQLLAEGGVVVGGAAAICLALFIAEVRLRFRKDWGDPAAYWIRTGAVAGLIGIALQETVEFSLQMPGNAVLFSFLCAVALSDLQWDATTRAAQPSTKKPKLELAFMAATAIVAVVAGTIAYRSSGPYGQPSSDHRIHRIYDVPAKRLVKLLYDASGNGLFDVSIELSNPTTIVIKRDPNEDGLPERWEYYGADHRLEKIGSSTRLDGQEDVWRSYNPDGTVRMIEYSANADRVITRREFYRNGALIREEDTGVEKRAERTVGS